MSSQTCTEELNSTKNQLPFSTDEQSFYTWLSNLTIEHKVDTLKLILTTLKSLHQVELEPGLRLIFVEKLSSLVYELSKKLQPDYIKSQLPYSKQDKLKLLVSTHCTIELAKNFALLCQDKYFNSDQIFSQQQKILITFYAIQAQAYVLLYKSMLYEKPDNGFWKLCFLLYLFAKKNNVLESKINANNSCFNNVFKQILIFELSNTQQFNTEEILTIFHLLDKQSVHINLHSKVSDLKSTVKPFIDLKEDAAPTLSKESEHQDEPNLLYICNFGFIIQCLDLLEHKTKLSDSNKAMLFRLIKSLTMNQPRKSDRKTVNSELYAIIGIDKLKDYLLQKKCTPENNDIAPGEIRDLDFELQPIDQKQEKSDVFRTELDAHVEFASRVEVIANLDRTNIWPEKKEEPIQAEKKPDTNVYLLDKSTCGMGIQLKNKDATTKVGEIISLIISDNLVITFVRRIIQSDKFGLLLGVEIIGINPELLDIIDIDNQGSATAFYLKNHEGTESIIIKTNDFQNEEYLFADRNEKIVKYKFEKQMHTSSMLKHLKVTPI